MESALAGRLSSALAGRYLIERQLGQGGMATVYLARDLRHDRLVALKVLRPELAAVIGADRFLQEIRVTAGLQHPHILPLHDSGEADHFLYYVMPYVEGESLRDRLQRERQLPVDEAVRVAVEAAAALDHAHGRGVIHRDIKPENILFTSGTAVVADFGIARAVTAAGGGRLTETGLSLGTPQYMSPEQATADRELDGRSDVYALGCVLYEMLTGEPPHTGPTTQSVIAKLLTEEPRPVLAGRPTVPPHVAAAVHRALARLPADRFRTAHDFADALTRPGSAIATAPAAPVARAARWSRLGLVAAGAILLLAGVGVGLALRPRQAPPPAPQVVRSTIPLPVGARVSQLQLNAPIALSPDGRLMVYSGERQLFLRRLDQLDPVPLPNTEGGVHPFFSPDGRHLGFIAGGNLKRIPVDGGPVITLCPVQSPSGGSWGPDDRIVFSAGGSLFTVSASGGTPIRVPVQDSAPTRPYRWPDLLPDGRRVLVTVGTRMTLETAVVDLQSGAVTTLEKSRSGARFVEPGWLLSFTSDGTGMATRFDWRNVRLVDTPRPLIEGIWLGLSGVARVGISRNGWIVYPPRASTRRQLVLVDRSGKETGVPTEPRTYSDPRFSPDGRALVVTDVVSGGGLAGDIWTINLEQGTLSRVTFEGRQQFPEWSSDGSRVVYSTLGTAPGSPQGLYAVPAGGGAAEQLLTRPVSEILIESILSHNGRYVLYRTGGMPSDMYYVPSDSLDRPRPLLTSAFDERAPALSPDDRWLAYVTNETGREEVYVRSFPEGGGRWLISAAGGSEPRWRRDGRELFYRNGDTLFAVPVQTTSGFTAGRRTMLFTGPYAVNGRHATYDVHPDGKTFVFVSDNSQMNGELILLQNLFPAEER